MSKIKNVVPYILGITTITVGATLIRKHNLKKKNLEQPEKENLSNNNLHTNIKDGQNRHYIELAEFGEKLNYMTASQLEENRHYIELDMAYVKAKIS